MVRLGAGCSGSRVVANWSEMFGCYPKKWTECPLITAGFKRPGEAEGGFLNWPGTERSSFLTTRGHMVLNLVKKGRVAVFLHQRSVFVERKGSGYGRPAILPVHMPASERRE